MRLAILLGLIQAIRCCQPGGWEEPGHHGPNDTQFLGNLSGWGVPDTGGESWKNYLKYYRNVSMNGSDTDENWARYYSKRHGGFPKEWEDYGPGSQGVPPPPWAYIPGHYGRPDACFMFPAVGHCTSKIIRWAYNPETKACQMFYYTGCGGNENNFAFKRDCEDACAKTPFNPCDPQDKIKFEDLLSTK